MKLSFKTFAQLILIIGLYFGAWRPIRGLISEFVIKPSVSEFLDYNSDKSIYLKEFNSISYSVHFKHEHETTKEYFFKVPGGIFFLLGSIALVFVVGWDSAILLKFLTLQSLVFVITLLFLYLGLYWGRWGIYLIDMLTRYGEAIVNIGFVLFFIQEKKKVANQLI